MNSGRGISQPTLTSMLGQRILAVSALILCVQILACAYENFSDHRYFSTGYIDMEVKRIGKGLRRDGAGLSYDMRYVPRHFLGPYAYHYAFRVSDASGNVLASSSSQILENALPTIGRGLIGPYTWYRKLDTGDWFHVAGGEPYRFGEGEVWIEVATLGDPAYQRMWALAHDLSKDVWIPSIPLIVITLGFVVFTVRAALKPLIGAAQRVEVIDSHTVKLGIDHSELPREIGVLTQAIDRLLQRNSTLLEAQRRLLAHSAHELRTPLSMMLLEIGNLKGDVASRLALDVRGMTSTVNQLLSIARLDALGALPSSDVDTSEIALRATRALQSLASARKCTIVMSSSEPQTFEGDPTAIYDALRNLLENAIRHTPQGSTVRITCGPGRIVRVEDSGPGFPSSTTPDLLFEPFIKGDASVDGAGLGLAIVKKAVELHNGTIDVGRSVLGGARVEVCFGGNAVAARAGASVVAAA